MNTSGNHRRWFGVIVIAIVCLAFSQAAELRGEEKKDPTAAKLAKELGAKLEELDAATARLERAEDDADINSAARQAQALVDWLVGHAKKIEQHFSERGEKEIAQAAADLGGVAHKVSEYPDSFFRGTDRSKAVAALKEVRESGNQVLILFGEPED